MALLQVQDVEVHFPTRDGTLVALQDVSFCLNKSERLGIVGESGAGKSVAAFAILNLVSRPGYIAKGSILFEGDDIVTMPESKLRQLRGNKITMIFQDPMMTLNPVLTIGTQLIECLQTHKGVGKKEARDIAVENLRKVHISSPESRIDQYPHELSGGMRQRVVIAIALLTEPSLIIADEPTTALDVTIQAEIMGLMLELCKKENVALILITHDLGVVSQITQRTIVMYAGRIIEAGATQDIIKSARHPYTKGLIKALPENAVSGHRLNQIPGVMPTLSTIPHGCAFHPRCQNSQPRCQTELPKFTGSEHTQVACFWWADQVSGQ